MQVRRECSQSAGKSSQLLHVILRIQVAGDGDDTSAMRDGSAQQFRRDASTDRGINRDRGKSRAPGRIAGNANDRDLALGQFPQKGIDARLIAGRENKAVVIFLQIGFNRFDIAFAAAAAKIPSLSGSKKEAICSGRCTTNRNRWFNFKLRAAKFGL